MGRITIFSLDDCPHCKRIKQAFTDRKIPYTEISLSLYPQKRNDMLSLSDRLTVPQIFFNDTHIGGADDTLKVIDEWDHNSKGWSPFIMYQRHVEKMDDPKDPRLQPSTDPPVVETPPPPRQPYIVHVPQPKTVATTTVNTATTTKKQKNNKVLTVLEMTQLLMRIVPRRDLKHKVTVYKKAFTGSDLMDSLVQEFNISRVDALKFGRYLQNEHHIVHHVAVNKKKDRRHHRDHELEDSHSLFFRLQADQTPNVLNSYRVWTERVDPDAMGLLKRLKKQLNKILGDHTDGEGKVNYLRAYQHKDFVAFEEAVCELQGVNFEAMPADTKLAFSINLYNLMIKFAFAKVGVGADNLNRGAFFSTVAFQVGGSFGKVYTMTFQDLENGVLRGNRKAPYALSRPFASKDERIKLVMDQVDNRIHFALNCGASSCPPVKNFTADGVKEELRIVAQAFCEDDDNVRLEGQTLYLSKILYWYSEDFGGSSEEVAKVVQGFLRGSKAEALRQTMATSTIKVKYNDYDWGTDASEGGFVPFAANSIKPNEFRVFY